MKERDISYQKTRDWLEQFIISSLLKIVNEYHHKNDKWPKHMLWFRDPSDKTIFFRYHLYNTRYWADLWAIKLHWDWLDMLLHMAYWCDDKETLQTIRDVPHLMDKLLKS